MTREEALAKKREYDRERYKKKYAENPEFFRNRARKNYEENKEYYAAYSKKYNKDKKEYFRQKSRDRLLKIKYNMGAEDYTTMLSEQNGGCAICGSPPEEGCFLKVDHCHNSEKVRGLLCNNCNTGIGLLKEDIDIMEKAIKYIKEHSK